MKSAPWIAGGLLVVAVGVVIAPGRTVTITEPATHPKINPPQPATEPETASEAAAALLPGVPSSSLGAGVTQASGPLWRLVDPQDYAQLPTLRGDVSGAQLFAIDRDRLKELTLGSDYTIVLPSPADTPIGQGGGEALQLSIERVTNSPSGNRQLFGLIDGQRSNRVVLTLGDRAIFGTLSTSRGIFNLSGKDDLAWIISARALSHHVDPTLPDTVSAPLEPRSE